MIGYKDQTWCQSNCINEFCFRYFSEKEKEKAIRWWGNENFPIALTDYSKDCEEYIPSEEEE